MKLRHGTFHLFRQNTMTFWSCTFVNFASISWSAKSSFKGIWWATSELLLVELWIICPGNASLPRMWVLTLFFVIFWLALPVFFFMMLFNLIHLPIHEFYFMAFQNRHFHTFCWNFFCDCRMYVWPCPSCSWGVNISNFNLVPSILTNYCS